MNLNRRKLFQSIAGLAVASKLPEVIAAPVLPDNPLRVTYSKSEPRTFQVSYTPPPRRKGRRKGRPEYAGVKIYMKSGDGDYSLIEESISVPLKTEAQTLYIVSRSE